MDELDHTWGSDTAKIDFVEAIADDQLSNDYDIAEDLKVSKKFYEQVRKPGNVLIPQITAAHNILPGDTTLLDVLIAVSGQSGTWKVPTTSALSDLAAYRQVTEESVNRIVWTKHVFGQDTSQRLADITNWALLQHEKSEQNLPIGVIPIALMSLEIKEEDYHMLVSDEYRGEEVTFTTNTEEYEGKTCWFPIKLILGDGYSWGIIFEQKINRLGDNVFSCVNNEPPREFVDFLTKIPAITAFFAPSAATEIEDWIRAATTSKKFEMNAAVDIRSLALLAGWRCPKLDSTTVSYLVTGMGFFRFFKWTEDFWIAPFQECRGEAKREVWAALKACYSIYATLLFSMLYEIYPDADVVCQTTRTTSSEFTDYWSALIASVLNTTGISEKAMQESTTRQQLCQAIRFLKNDTKLSSEAPYRVKKIIQLLGPWPPISKGGPRFLPVVREHFFLQHQVVKEFPLQSFEYVFDQVLQPYHKYYGRFGISASVIASLDTAQPITSRNASLHLIQHPALSSVTIDLNLGGRMSYKVVTDKAKEAKRPMRDVVLEWARLNVDRLPRLFITLAENQDILDLFSPYYENMRIMHLNLGHLPPVRVQVLEDRMEANRLTDKEKYRVKMERLDETIDSLKKHKATLQSAMEMMNSDEQRGFRTNRIEHRELTSSIPSLRQHWRQKNKKTGGQIVKNPNILPLGQRMLQHLEPVPAPPPLPGRPSWTESGEHPRQVPSTARALKRARSRSAARDDTPAYKSKEPCRSKSRSRSRGRRQTKKPPVSTTPVDVKHEPEPGPSTREPEVIDVDDSPLRSPSIEIDYGSD